MSKSPIDFELKWLRAVGFRATSSKMNGGSEHIPVFETCFKHMGMLRTDRRKLDPIRK